MPRTKTISWVRRGESREPFNRAPLSPTHAHPLYLFSQTYLLSCVLLLRFALRHRFSLARFPMFASTPAPLRPDACPTTTYSWVNRRGYGFNVFDSEARKPTTHQANRLEPLTDAGSCTYLNKAALTPKVDARLKKDMTRYCGLCPSASTCPTPSMTTSTCCNSRREPVACGHGGSTWTRGGCPRPGSGRC